MILRLLARKRQAHLQSNQSRRQREKVSQRHYRRSEAPKVYCYGVSSETIERVVLLGMVT